MENINESTTVVRYIVPQLQELGWALEDIKIGINYRDITIFNGKFVIEAKKFGSLSNSQYKYYRFGVPQLQEYLRGTGLTIGCLTDGQSWYWVTLDSVHKIEDMQELSKNSIKSNSSIRLTKTRTVTVEDWPLNSPKRSVKVTVPIGYDLTKTEINNILK